MTTLPNLPVYIVYDDAVVNESSLSTEVQSLRRSLQPRLDGKAVLRLTVIRPGELSELPKDRSSRRLDLGAAFKRIASDLSQRHCSNPEVLVLLGTWPIDDWVDGWRKLEPMRAMILSYWFEQSARTGPGPAQIEALLRQISPAEEGSSRHKVVPAGNGQDHLRMLFQKLRERILYRKEGTATLSPGRIAPASASAAPASVPEEEPVVMLESPEEADESKAPSAPAPPAKAQWEEKEPTDPNDPYPHLRTDSCEGGRGWYMVGASRRGRLHAHEGTYREDAFAMGYTAGWHLVAVADGAGSHRLSRVGSNEAVTTAVEKMKEAFADQPPSKAQAKVALQDALKAAWGKLSEEAKTRGIDFKDLGTTLLLLAHHPDKSLVGVAQIGDGLLAAMSEDRTIHLLGKPESGEYSGQTLFLTNHKPEELLSKVETQELPGLILLLTMTDGVADDLYPPQEKLSSLIKALPPVVASEDPQTALLEMINYERQGSFDDRTLVVLCKKEKLLSLQKAAGPSTPQENEDGRDAG